MSDDLKEIKEGLQKLIIVMEEACNILKRAAEDITMIIEKFDRWIEELKEKNNNTNKMINMIPQELNKVIDGIVSDLKGKY